MRVVALASTKGGSSKSSLAFALGLEAAYAGRRVAVVDTDAPQGTLGLFVAARGDREPRVALHSTRNPFEDVPPLADRYDVAIVDAGGRDTGTMRRALAVADEVVIPCRAAAADLWALEDIYTTIDKLLEVRPVRAIVVLVQLPPGSLGDEARELIRADLRPGVELAHATIGSRVIWSRALASGLAPRELEPHGPAAAEVHDLARELRLLKRG